MAPADRRAVRGTGRRAFVAGLLATTAHAGEMPTAAPTSNSNGVPAAASTNPRPKSPLSTVPRSTQPSSKPAAPQLKSQPRAAPSGSRPWDARPRRPREPSYGPAFCRSAPTSRWSIPSTIRMPAAPRSRSRSRLPDPFNTPSAEPSPRDDESAPPTTPPGEPAAVESRTASVWRDVALAHRAVSRGVGEEEPSPGGLLEGLGTPAATTCEEYQSECRRVGREMAARDIRQIVVGLVIEGVENEDFPCECPLIGEAYNGRNFAPTTFTWKATGVCHKPLYFEDVQLERVRPLLESGGAAVPLGCALLRFDSAVALQDGRDSAARMHLHAGLLPSRQLCSVRHRADSA